MGTVVSIVSEHIALPEPRVDPNQTLASAHFAVTSDGERTYYQINHGVAERHSFVILLSHGNMENTYISLARINRFLTRFPYCIVVNYDYPTNGNSTGPRTELGLNLAVESVYYQVVEKLNLPVVLWGRSIGSSPTCHLATKTKPAAIVLESAIASVKFMIPKFAEFVLFGPLQQPFDNLDRIDSQTWPRTFIVHGMCDTILNYSDHAVSLYKKVTALEEIPGLFEYEKSLQEMCHNQGAKVDALVNSIDIKNAWVEYQQLKKEKQAFIVASGKHTLLLYPFAQHNDVLKYMNQTLNVLADAL